MAADPVDTVTGRAFTRAAPAYGDTIHVTPGVTQVGGGAVPVGVLQLDAAPTEEDLWGGEVVDVAFAQLLPEDSAAGVELDLDEDMLPFLADSDGLWLAARYVPFYAGVSYADQFNASESTPVFIDLPEREGEPTTTRVTAPDSATAGEETTLKARVRPADADGTVTFSVDGETTSPVAVDDDGVAATRYTFASAGTVTVTAQFQPDDPGIHAASSGAREVEVAPGATSSTEGDPVDEDDATTYGSTCNFESRPGVASRAVPPSGLLDMFVTFAFQPLNGLLNPIVPAPFWFGSFLNQFLSINFDTIFRGLQIRIGPCGPHLVPRGQKPGSGMRAQVTETTVPCARTDDGFQCALPDLGPDMEIEVKAPFVLPAVVAGRNLGVTGTIDGTDDTGQAWTIGSHEHVIEVPKRTVLSARLAPVKKGATSVRRGQAVAYRLAVKNAGVVTADEVKACVSVGRGAAIGTAKGATVRGRRACWTLPSLHAAKSVARTLTVVAPRRAGTLGLSAVVTPRRSQATPVRLVTVLPVT